MIDAYPGSWSAKAFRQLAEAVNRLPARSNAQGVIEFFFERLLLAGPRHVGGAS